MNCGGGDPAVASRMPATEYPKKRRTDASMSAVVGTLPHDPAAAQNTATADEAGVVQKYLISRKEKNISRPL